MMCTDIGNQMGSILAYVDGGPGSEDVIRTAIQYGQVFSSYVEVLHIKNTFDLSSFMLTPEMGMGATAEIADLMKKEVDAHAATARNAFENLYNGTEKSELPTGLSFKEVSGHDARELAHRGRFFDLIIMAQATEQLGGVDSVQLEAALFDTGRPVLITSNIPQTSIASSIVIAWDGSREAAHSVKLSLPILSKAERVYVVSVGACEPGTGSEELSEYLARHNIECETCAPSDAEKSVAKTLITTSHDKQANLLVMGAYGHSQLSESLFGGVTRDILESGDFSLLMAH